MRYCATGHFIGLAEPVYLLCLLATDNSILHSTVFDPCAQDTVELSVLIAQYST